MNPIIKFTTLFGLLTVDLAEQLGKNNHSTRLIVGLVLFICSAFFVYRSFYGMRIDTAQKSEHGAGTPAPAKNAA